MKRTLFLIAGFVVLAAAGSAQSTRLGRYALVLEDPPLIARIGSRAELGSPRAQAALAAIQARQAQVREELERRGFRVTGSVHTLVNAVFVQGEPRDAARLKGIAGARATGLLPPMKRRLDTALNLLRIPEAWTRLPSGMANAGAGVDIAIIDSGIDQTHPAFQTACATAPAQAKCSGADCNYTNGKVVAARSYVRFMAEGSEQTSRPDDLSPRDRDGHGTALAMIAAGNQVTAPGGTISGVAPRACLGNYKVFGSPGVNDWASYDGIATALEDAFNDGMDIASLSLGGSAWYSPLDKGDTTACGAPAGEFCDFLVQEVEQATQRGMTVVVAAGNSGDYGLDANGEAVPTMNTIETPGIAPSAISVGASTNSHVWSPGVRVTGSDVPSNLTFIPGWFGNGPKPAGPTDPAPLRDVSTIGDAEACSALPQGSLTGAVAIVKRGTCDFSVKVNYAQVAGARAVIIHLNEGETRFIAVGLDRTSIPAIFINYSDAAALKSFLATHPDRPAVLDPTLHSMPETADLVAVFSSRGPVIGNFGIKPEVLGVGTAVYSATQNYDPNGAMYDASRYTAASGTSFSAPMIAGVAALVKQKNPTFTPAQIKSAIVNTATPAPADSEPLRILEQGAGKANAEAAVQTNVTVEPATVSFGNVAGATLPKTVILRVNAPAGVTLTSQVQQAVPDSRAQVVVTAIRSDQVDIQLQGQTPSPGVYHGVIILRGGAVDLRVPYAYFVGENVPYSIAGLAGDMFDWPVNSSLSGCSFDPSEASGGVSLAFKVVDRFGAPITVPSSTPDVIEWQPVIGGGQLKCQGTGSSRVCDVDGKPDRYGLAAACVVTGPNPGEQSFRATVNYMGRALSYDFYGTARLWPAINVGGVVDAASYTDQPGLVAGSLISIFGNALVDAAEAWAQPVPNQPLNLPISLAGTSVSFDVPSQGISVPGRLLFARRDPGQLNVQIPWEVAGQSQVFMKVSIGDFSSAVYTLPLANAAPQLYQYAPNSSMAGFAIAQDGLNFSLLNLTNRARRGQWITLWGNSFGPVNGQPVTGESPGTFLTLKSTPAVTVGGKPVTELAAGLHPQYIGLYQMNIRIPDDAPSGTQPIIITINGVSSKPANIVVE